MIPNLSDTTFGFLMFPGYEELDMIGPWEMGTMWQTYAKGPKCITLAQEAGEITCAKGLRTIDDHAFDIAPAVDFLLVPGGFAALEEAKNPLMIDYLSRMAGSVEHMLSVCTGSSMLEAAGLLKGKRATTHWKLADQLPAAEGVRLVQERYVRDGTIWTSAGVSAGIVQHNAEYYPNSKIYGQQSQREGSPTYARKLLTEYALQMPARRNAQRCLKAKSSSGSQSAAARTARKSGTRLLVKL